MEQDNKYWQFLNELRGARDIGEFYVPQLVTDIFKIYLEGMEANIICDPWAGMGRLVTMVQEATHAKNAIAIANNERAATVGKQYTENVEWYLGDPLDYLSKTDITFDIVASILPFDIRYPFFGRNWNELVSYPSQSGENIDLKGNIEHLILVSASKKLKKDGIGIYILPASFFNSSIFTLLAALGLGMEAAIQLPSGTFSPYTSISTYLVVIRKQQICETFIGVFSTESTTNAEIISNLKNHRTGGSLEFGQYIECKSFKGIEQIRHRERIKQAELMFGAPPIKLGEISLEINMGHFGEGFVFPQKDNSLFIPLLGTSDVLDTTDNLTLRNQNYAQVIIDSAHSNSRFVAQFLNSDLGREILNAYKTGTTMSKLNKQSIMHMDIFIPDLMTQKSMLELETKITAEENALRGLQNEINKYRHELWSNPKSATAIQNKLQVFSNLISDRAKEHVDETLWQWVETLPFPLASIIRTWQATPSKDYQNKVTHLLHFFEATAEFVSIILLSAFSSNQEVFTTHKQKLLDNAQKYHISFQHATFGTWKMFVDYFGKQIRDMLSDIRDTGGALSTMFASPSLELPKMLSDMKFSDLLSQANQMRNNWAGHSGYVGIEESLLRNEELIGKLQELREIMGGIWNQTQLIKADYCKLHSGIFLHEVAIMMGSHSEFLKEEREMSECLDINRLYIANKDGKRALKILPLVEIEAPPQSVKNACYFFNRTEKDGIRYIAYHFSDKPERVEAVGELDEVMKIFVEGK